MVYIGYIVLKDWRNDRNLRNNINRTIQNNVNEVYQNDDENDEN